MNTTAGAAEIPRDVVSRWLDSDRPLVYPEGNESLLYRAFKRGLDITGAVVAIVLFAPIMFAVWAILMVTTKGHPIYVQERIGYCGRRFKMYKFRSMVMNATAVQHMVTNEQAGPVFKNRRDPRITRIGRFIRSTSIDEMPQLFNVLKGDMALVGPRPPIASEVMKYEPWQRRRLAIKPGLTCLWQVSGRNEIGFEDWVRMDLWYSKNQNMKTDFRLLWRTPLSVLSRKGAY